MVNVNFIYKLEIVFKMFETGIGRKALVKKYDELLNSNDINAQDIWASFKELAIRDYNSKMPIPEISLILKKIEHHYPKKLKSKVFILDHGCGSGFPDLYWIANGYTNIVCFDIYSQEKSKIYQKLNNILDFKRDVFNIYDGFSLPIDDKSIDIINSNAVVEHLPDEVYEKYFIEEGRVLKDKGISLHVIPQRLQPYDSHTQTWFVHWLPEVFHTPLVKAFGRYNPDLVLKLRTKYTHIKYINNHIGQSKDLSLEYFMNTKIKQEDYYDRQKRGIFFQVCNLPILKYFLPQMFKPLLCLILVSKK